MGLIFPISSRPIMQGPISALITTRYRRQAYRLSNVGVYTNVAEGFEERNTRDERPKQKSCTREVHECKREKARESLVQTRESYVHTQVRCGMVCPLHRAHEQSQKGRERGERWVSEW